MCRVAGYRLLTVLVVALAGVFGGRAAARTPTPDDWLSSVSSGMLTAASERGLAERVVYERGAAERGVAQLMEPYCRRGSFHS